MFINVAIAPDIVHEVSHRRSGFASNLVRKQLFELIAKYGAISQPSNESAKALVDALRAEGLTASEQKEWREFLVSLRTKKRFSVVEPEIQMFWERVYDPHSYASLRSISSTLNIIAEEDFHSMFSDETGIHTVGSQIEVAVPATAAFSESALRLNSLIEEGTYAEGTSREQIWEELLGPLAASSTHVTIFDPYLYFRLWQNSLQARPRGEHLEWLLAKFDRVEAKRLVVTLVGAAGDGKTMSPPKDPDAVLDFLEAHFNGFLDSKVEVEAFVVPSRKDMHHDRHLSFNSGQALEFPSGVDRFAVPNLRDSISFTYRHTPKSLQALHQREAEAKTHSTAVARIG